MSKLYENELKIAKDEELFHSDEYEEDDEEDDEENG